MMKGLDDIVQNVGTSLSINIDFFIKHLESNTKHSTCQLSQMIPYNRGKDE